MVLDTSAITATITNEPDSARYQAAMLGAESLLISSVAVLETRIVLFARLGVNAVSLFDDLLEKAGRWIEMRKAKASKGAVGTARQLDKLIEEATVDCYNEEEQA